MASTRHRDSWGRLALVVSVMILGAPVAEADSGPNLSFLRLPSISIGKGCCSVITADFNGDGNMDIAATHETAALTILLGDGKGNFTRKDVALALGPGVVLEGLVASADLNGDHIADIVAITSNASGSGSAVLLGLGDGSFRATLLDSNVAKAVGDFNHDGKLDLLVHPCAWDIDCGFAVRLGNGDGTFQPVGPVTMQPSGDFEWAVVADFNGDGKLDVVETCFRSPATMSVYLWLGNGDGTFGSPMATKLTGDGDVYSSLVATGDFNGDGHPDLAVLVNLFTRVGDCCIEGLYGIELLLGDGTGAFRPGSIYPVPGTAPLLAADFQHAGRIDLVAGFTILGGSGDGTLRPAQSFGQYFEPTTGWGTSLVAAGDFNRDGKTDLVGPANDGTQLSILINNTPGLDNSANAVSAADYSPQVASGSIASIFGSQLATSPAQATGPPWPTSLANTSVRVTDVNGVERLAELLYVSPTQVNFVIPPATAPGFAIFNVAGVQGLPEGSRSTLVVPFAPVLFTLNGTGQGVPVATATRVNADGSQTPVPVAQCSPGGACTLVPINVSGGNVYLSLYGTGFHQASAAQCFLSTDTTIRGGGVVPVTYVGPQPTIPGLDQLNLRLPGTLPSGIDVVQCVFPTLIPDNLFISFRIAIQ